MIRTHWIVMILMVLFGIALGIAGTARFAARDIDQRTEWGLQCQASGGHLYQGPDDLHCIPAGQP